MRTIIHDLTMDDLKEFSFDKDDKVFSSLECKRNCVGCFSCWIKHPKKCALNDNFSDMAEYLKDSDELIIISKNRYGCYSSETKKVLERCIGYVMPHFMIRNNEVHHISRYEDKLRLSVIFYGDVTSQEKKSIERLVKANAINLNTSSYNINYFSNAKEALECIH